MPSRAHGPEPCASANFATRADSATLAQRCIPPTAPGSAPREPPHTRSVVFATFASGAPPTKRANSPEAQIPPQGAGERRCPGLSHPVRITYEGDDRNGDAVGVLDNFERGLERVVNGAFAKTFRSGLAPIEITSALRQELDTKAAVVSRDRILVPNRFVVRLGRTDHQKMAAMGPTLTDELTQLVQTHATAQGYQFAGGIDIRLTEDRR